MCISEKYISPLTDFGFKKIFGDEENTQILQSLINDILGLEGEKKIKNIIFKNGELLPDSIDDRKAIFDLYCEDEEGNSFIVELQKVYQEHFQSRALYYTSFPISGQSSRGDWDFQLTPVYFIGLLDFEVDRFKDNPNYIHHGKITDIYTKEVMYDQLNMIYIEIPKLKKKKEEITKHLEWWIYVIQNLHKLNDIPDNLKGDIIEDAFNKANFLKLSKEEQAKYHQNLKIYRDLVNSFSSAKNKGFEKGLKKGIEAGIQEGLKQGIEKGIEKGIKQQKIEIAKNLLDILDIETISSKTGLTKEEIQRLK